MRPPIHALIGLSTCTLTLFLTDISACDEIEICDGIDNDGDGRSRTRAARNS